MDSQETANLVQPCIRVCGCKGNSLLSNRNNDVFTEHSIVVLVFALLPVMNVAMHVAYCLSLNI